VHISGQYKWVWASSVPAICKKAAPSEEQMGQTAQTVISVPSEISTGERGAFELVRGLGLWSATAAVVGVVIGQAGPASLTALASAQTPEEGIERRLGESA
jgi:hypothetical protein